MKNIAYIFGLVIILYSCGAESISEKKAEEKIIVTDTITINIEGQLQQSIVWKNKFYCFFSEDIPYGGSKFVFYIISRSGEIEKTINVPHEMCNWYFDLHLRNDSILVKDYYDDNTYFFNTNNLEWVRIDKTDDMVFEDEDYYFTYLTLSEWGGTLWIKNKITSVEYEMLADEPIVNKLDGKYYVTVSNAVVKISDPLLMKQCDTVNYYQNHRNEIGGFWVSNSFQGTEFIYLDTTHSYYSRNFYIATSFVMENQLQHICVDSNNVYRTFIEKEKMIVIDTIAYNMQVYKETNSYRGNINKNKFQILHFRTNDKGNYGLIEIDEKQIKIHYFNNINKANILGTQNAKKAFIDLFDYITKNIGNLSLSQIKKLELNLGAKEVTPGHKMSIGESYYPNKNNYVIESPIVYKKIEDSTITMLTNYYYTKKDESVKVFSCEWSKTHENGYSIYATENEDSLKEAYVNKFNYIYFCIEESFGKPTVIEKDGKGNSYRWSSNTGLEIELYYSDYQRYHHISLKIYKE